MLTKPLNSKSFPSRTLLACGLSLCFNLCAAKQPDVTVIYLDRYPFNYSLTTTTVDTPAGPFIEYTTQIFQQASINVSFSMQPSARIMRSISENQQPYCALAYIKNKEREQFANFSLPFYREEPMMLVALKKNAARFEPHATVESIFKDKSLVLGEGSDKSYGHVIDTQKKAHPPRLFKAQTNINLFLKMLEAERFDYVLTVPTEVKALMKRTHIDPTHFLFKPLEDVTEVNDRYFMCSKKVSLDIIQRINAELIKSPLPASELNPIPISSEELAAILNAT